MRRSKLMLYEEILCSLHNNSKTIDEIAYYVNMDCLALRTRLEFLLKNRLVEEKIYKKNTLFALTKRGLAIYKTLTITRQLKKLQNNIQKIHKAQESIQFFTAQELKKHNQNIKDGK